MFALLAVLAFYACTTDVHTHTGKRRSQWLGSSVNGSATESSTRALVPLTNVTSEIVDFNYGTRMAWPNNKHEDHLPAYTVVSKVAILH